MSDEQASVAATSLHVALVEPEIPGNTGNVGRSCLAAGAQLHLIEPLGFSLDARQVRRSGVHHWRRVEPRVWPSFTAFEAELETLGEPFLFTARSGRPLGEVVFPARVVLIFGRESAGLPPAIREAYPDRWVQIPLVAVPDISLNLSTSAGIALYEVLRQRRRSSGGP